MLRVGVLGDDAKIVLNKEWSWQYISWTGDYIDDGGC